MVCHAVFKSLSPTKLRKHLLGEVNRHIRICDAVTEHIRRRLREILEVPGVEEEEEEE
jgi:hypothetical protein